MGSRERDRHCSKCGRILIPVVVPDGFNRQTGDRVMVNYLECPRFRRSWRNLGMGGIGHDSLSVENPMIGREWR